MNEEQRMAEIKVLRRVANKACREMDADGVLNNWTEFTVKKHLDWLIEQAERVQELEQENIGLKQDLKDASDRLEWVSDV